MARQIPLRWVIAVAVLAIGLGVLAGIRAPWGTQHPRVVDGTAMRANTENDLVLFDAADGTQLVMHAEATWWVSDSAEGESDPPCLRTPLRKVPVEIGYLTIARPDGGSFQQVVWVRCPG